MNAPATETRSSNPPGSRWWSIDLHAHSPASFDFGGLEGERSESQPSFKEWLRAYLETPLDAIVITDHNSHEGIDAARNALDELRSEEDLRDLIIFPGVEITTYGGWHLLGVFDVDTPSETINGLLHKCGYAGTRGDSNATTAKPFADVVDLIAEHGGLAIPAHADGRRGVFEMDPRDLESLVQSNTVLAAEIIGDSGLQRATRYKWVPVLGSDAHHLDLSDCPPGIEGKAPGTHFTRIKMEVPNLEGIRLAFADGVASVQRARHDSDDLNDTAHNWIASITVRNPGASTYTFNPRLNAVIGGRGVGKSTLAELVRLTLARTDELPGSLASDLAWFSPQQGASEAARFWTPQTEVQIEYRKGTRDYRVTWKASSGLHTIEALEQCGDWQQEDGRVTDRFPVQLFSQKQIFETAKDPQSLLRIIDSQSALDHSAWQKRHEELCSLYRRVRSQIHEAQTIAGSAGDLRGRLADVEAQLGQLSAIANSAEMAELSVAQRYVNAFNAQERIAQQSMARIREAIDEAAEVHAVSDENDDEAAKGHRSGVRAALKIIEQGLASYESLISTWTQRSPTGLFLRLTELEQWAAAQSSGPSGSGRTIQELRQQQQGLSKELEEAEAAELRAKELGQRADDLLVQVEESRKRITNLRREYVSTLRPQGQTLRVSVYGQANLKSLEGQLRNLLRKETSFDSLFSSDTGLRSALNGRNPKDPRFYQTVAEFKALLVSLVNDGATSTKLATYPGTTIDQRFFSHLASLDSFEVETEIGLWFPDDSIEVQYKPEGEGNYKSVEEGSPGQRTAALLALILQMGTEPLVLDQPEDDLENRLVSELVVKSIKRIKSARQVLVMTHNANIVVNGDAENVLVLAHGEMPEVAVSGTLQRASVRKEVCDILEGGETAIRDRFRRLGFGE